MIPKLGPLEIVVILIVVLLIFGPKNLPKLASAIGKSVKNLREGLDSGKKDKKDIEDAAKDKAQRPAREDGEEEAEFVVEDKPAPKSKAKAGGADDEA